MNGFPWICVLVPLAALFPLGSVMAADAADEARPTVEKSTAPKGLEFRRIERDSIATQGEPLPREAVQVFTYEGQPAGVRVTDRHIGVDYGRSGVLFARATGELVRRLTVADGWPGVRPDDFPPMLEHRLRKRLVGPGVLEVWRSESPLKTHDTAASVEFAGATWRAQQPADFLRNLHKRTGNDYSKLRDRYGAWTPILRDLNAESFVEAQSGDGGATVRYTMDDGLAGNIVTHLAAAEGKLWAACVDIYDPQKKDWGPGGLCCFDPQTRRWQRIDKIDGRPVRWVTLVQNVDGALWIGFREGSGIAGDSVSYGMGLYPGQYRPETTAMVLARLSDGKWRSFAREPLPGKSRNASPPPVPPGGQPPKKDPPTEVPRTLAILGDKLFLFSETDARSWGNWTLEANGNISLLDLGSGKWQTFAVKEDFEAFRIDRMVADRGEVVVCTNRGAHRWSPSERKWNFLDSHSPILNPNLSAAATIGDEFWIGYTNQAFGVIGRQGISRFNEKTLQWSYASPEQIGTGSPVRNIVRAPDGSAWVLFHQRQWMGSAMEFSLYPEAAWNAPGGLGRFAAGKWEFPIKLDGVPESRKRQWQGPNGLETFNEPMPISHVARAGQRLFATNAMGVYQGPGKWQQIVEGDVRGIQPTDDGKALHVRLHVPGASSPNSQVQLHDVQYDLATGKKSVSIIKEPTWDDWRLLEESDYLLRYHYRPNQWLQQWVAAPTKRDGQWAVGLLGTNHHAVVETPHAVWIASEGELMRLDRKRLAQWLGAGHE